MLTCTDFLIEIKRKLLSLNKAELDSKLQGIEIPPARKLLLAEILKGERSLNQEDELDILLYVAKEAFQELFESCDLSTHPINKSDLLIYHPPKNGQNILKHGVSFPEVISFSTRFGSITVPYTTNSGETRSVVFSDLKNLAQRSDLALPLDSIDPARSYVTSVVINLTIKTRFISSRTAINITNKVKLNQLIKDYVYPEDDAKRDRFIQECQDTIRSGLIS